MNTEKLSKNLKIQWVKTGIASGLTTFIVYPVMSFIDLPVQITLLLAFSFGIFFMLASVGLYNFISANSKSAILQSALLFNIIGCAVVVMMLTIQLALFSKAKYISGDASRDLVKYIFSLTNLVQLSLDVVWDMFISLGTILFALSMFRHPKLGRIIGSIGILAGGALLFNNVYTFPVPPAEAGSIDFGPFVALWYLAVTIMMIRWLKWLKETPAPAGNITGQ
jgi:Domain of unknown function (DUF4386)